MSQFLAFLEQTKGKGASDLHIICNEPARVRVEGELCLLDENVITREQTEAMIAEVLSLSEIQKFNEEKEAAVAYELPCGTRFRINIFYEKGSPALVARLIYSHIPSLEDIGLTDSALDLVRSGSGLVLVTGKTGQGKSTTLASLIQHLAATTSKNIVTLEDPIEYVFKSDKALVKQREVGRDINSFHESLKYLVRHDPDIIMVGEMRDPETMRAALTLAETGHLVFSTLHTSSAKQTINRIVDSFSAEQQNQIRSQLALSLRGIISQVLVKGSDGKRVAVREILVNNPAIAHLIRENKIEQIDSILQTNIHEGMMTLDHSLGKLYRNGAISFDIVRKYATDFQVVVSE